MTVAPLHPLFDHVEQTARATLLASGLGRLRPGTKNVDLFAGGGGWGLAARRLGVQVHYAINHSKVAIATHAENFPGCVHHMGDAWKVRPRDVVGNDEIDVLLASAACTTHSNARGGVPISKRVHMLGWCIARWIRDVRPRLILVENVPEWLKWGPLVPMRHKNGRVVRDHRGKIALRPDRSREGQHFKRWIRQCRRLGYVVEWRVMDAADYGEASRRKRLFVQMRRDGAPIVWPEVTHGNGKDLSHARSEVLQTSWKAGVDPVGNDGASTLHVSTPQEMDSSMRTWSRHGGHQPCSSGRVSREAQTRVVGKREAWAVGEGSGTQQQHGLARSPGDSLRSLGLTPFRTAADIIDWSDLGRSLFVRKATKAKPFGLAPKSIGRICEGISRFVLNNADPFLLSTVYGDGWHVRSVRDTMPTQTTRQDLGLCVPVIAPQNTDVYGRPTNEPGPTITTKGHQSLVAPVLGVLAHGDGQDDTKRWGRPALPVDGPLNAIHAGGNNFGVATAFMAYANQGAVQTGPVTQPGRTIVAGGLHAGIAAPIAIEYYGTSSNARRVEESLGAVVTHDRHGLVTPVVGELSPAWVERARTVGKMLKAHLGDRVNLNAAGMVEVTIRGIVYVVVDVLFRMLKVHELAAAMGFPPDYKWPINTRGKINQREAVKLIGNAISVRNGAALLGAMLPELVRDIREAVA